MAMSIKARVAASLPSVVRTAGSFASVDGAPFLHADRSRFQPRRRSWMGKATVHRQMSAKGHSRCLQHARHLSDLLPITALPDAVANRRDGPQPDMATLFDHVVGAGKQRRWHGQTGRLRGL